MVASEVVVRQSDAGWTSTGEAIVMRRRQQTQVTAAAIFTQIRAVHYINNNTQQLVIVRSRFRPFPGCNPLCVVVVVVVLSLIHISEPTRPY